MNADSKLSYGKDFGNHIREVYLTGEAYFDVVKDKKSHSLFIPIISI
ncbi:FecR family protein [Niabella hibiscisoli]|nr:FecR family protein [Niabella hibiscisoli]MCH5720242.1 FecR family protein [Niabella hibiscisoli]